MGAGDLRHVVDVQSPLHGGVNPRGGRSKTWQTVKRRVPCLVEEKTFEEADERGRRAVEKTYEVTMRFLPDIYSSDRLIWDGRRLHIKTIVTDRKRRHLKITAGEDG